MTGYAHHAAETPAGHISFELRSVNARFTEPVIRLPDDLRALEPALRERIQATVSRGKVECRIQWRPRTPPPRTDMLDEPVVRNLLGLASAARALAPNAAGLTVADILRWPGAVHNPDAPPNDSADHAPGNAAMLWAAVEPVAAQACQAFLSMRRGEGERLASIMRGALQDMSTEVAHIRNHLPELIALAAERLHTRLAEALPAELAARIPPEETLARIRQEVSLLSLRADVAEELDRISSHITGMLETLAQGGAIGKRLDFISQEMNREANTIGSKAVALPVTDAAIRLKLLIEQLREQAQNIE